MHFRQTVILLIVLAIMLFVSRVIAETIQVPYDLRIIRGVNANGNIDGSRDNTDWSYYPHQINDDDNYVIDFDGISGCGRIPHHEDYNVGAEDFTIECLVKLESWPEGAYDTRIISKVVSNEHYIAIMVTVDDHELVFAGRGGNVEWVVYGPGLELNQWYHIAGIRDRNQFILMLNGEEVNSGVTDDVGDVNNEQSWGIGYFDDGEDSRYYTDGCFDEVRFWNSARSTEEIAINAWQELDDPAEENLMGYWQFNEGISNRFADLSQTGNDGALNGDFEWIEAEWDPNEVAAEKFSIPPIYSLSQPFPNPFNSTTNIRFTLPGSDWVSLKLFDPTGRELTTLVNGFMGAGKHAISWNGRDFNSGVYFVKLMTSQGVSERSVVLVR